MIARRFEFFGPAETGAEEECEIFLLDDFIANPAVAREAPEPGVEVVIIVAAVDEVGPF